jgi:hypothetical protein
MAALQLCDLSFVLNATTCFNNYIIKNLNQSWDSVFQDMTSDEPAGVSFWFFKGCYIH